MSQHPLIKIVSGGQTGVDRAGLDAAMFLGIDHGGWCPRGRRAEDGRIPDHYQLVETESRNYAARTQQNVIDSDGTLILYRNLVSGGTELTVRFTHKHQRPVLQIDLESIFENNEIAIDQTTAADQLRTFLKTENIQVLNVAGPRESNSPGIGKDAERFIIGALSDTRG